MYVYVFVISIVTCDLFVNVFCAGCLISC